VVNPILQPDEGKRCCSTYSSITIGKGKNPGEQQSREVCWVSTRSFGPSLEQLASGVLQRAVVFPYRICRGELVLRRGTAPGGERYIGGCGLWVLDYMFILGVPWLLRESIWRRV